MVDISCTAWEQSHTSAFMFTLERINRSEKTQHILLGDKIEYYAKDLLPDSLNNLGGKSLCVEMEILLIFFFQI